MKQSVILLLFAKLCYGCWAWLPLSERVKEAELIVVGTLTDVVEKHFSITYYKEEKINYSRYYDVGEIEVTRFLKTPGYTPIFVPIAFHSREQRGPCGTGPIDSTDINLNEGDYGIWLLERDGFFTRFFYIMRPDNLLPSELLCEIEDIIRGEKRCSQR
jgi:hypothetical protein